MFKFRAIKRIDLEEIKNKENNMVIKEYLDSIIKNGTEIWITKNNNIGVHLGMNDYIIVDKEANKELINILNKVKIETDIIDKNTINTFDNRFGKKEYIHYLTDYELNNDYKKKKFYL